MQTEISAAPLSFVWSNSGQLIRIERFDDFPDMRATILFQLAGTFQIGTDYLIKKDTDYSWKYAYRWRELASIEIADLVWKTIGVAGHKFLIQYDEGKKSLRFIVRDELFCSYEI